MFRRNWLTGLLAVLLSLTVALGGVAATAAETRPDLRNLLDTVVSLVTLYYKDQVNRDQVLKGAIDGALHSLGDPYSVYMEPEEYQAFVDSISGKLEGIGVFLDERNQYIMVQAPIKGSPADQAGIRAGDRILEVNGQNLVGEPMEKAINLIRGPAGSSLKLKLERPQENRVYEVELTRAAISIPVVEHELRAGQVGYIKIWTFSLDMPQRVLNAYRELERQGMKSLVVDIRDNGGGYVDAAVRLTSFWLPKDAVITKMVSRGQIREELRAFGNNIVTVPTVVLVNENSASASEIFAGALQDAGAAQLVGVRTFGKGTVQSLISLTGGGVLKLTTSEYLTPKGRKVHEVGLTPDVTVERPAPDPQRTSPLQTSQVIRPGQVSLQVLFLQQRLNDLGYKAGEENGVFGAHTQRALEQFQQAKGLPVSGTADAHTLDALNAAVLSRQYEDAADPQWEKAVEILGGLLTASQG